LLFTLVINILPRRANWSLAVADKHKLACRRLQQITKVAYLVETHCRRVCVTAKHDQLAENVGEGQKVFAHTMTVAQFIYLKKNSNTWSNI
jgi:hypothetical protein